MTKSDQRWESMAPGLVIELVVGVRESLDGPDRITHRYIHVIPEKYAEIVSDRASLADIVKYHAGTFAESIEKGLSL